jgi:hypothetical protein
MLPTVGQEPRPVVVSLSPHLVETQSSEIEHSSRCIRRQVDEFLRGPGGGADRFEIALLLDGELRHRLAGFAMPSTMRLVQPGSMPITTTAATFGLAPVPMMVRKCSSRSSPNCRRP